MPSEIAPSSNERCVHRGISIMRLALGYETGLPEGWWFKPNGGLNSGFSFKDEVHQVLRSFPGRTVRIICTNHDAEEWGLSRNEYITRYRTNLDKFFDKNLFAFSYIWKVTENHVYAHFAVASVILENEKRLVYGLMVSIERQKAKSRGLHLDK